MACISAIPPPYSLILLATLHLQTLPYENQVVAIFFFANMAAIINLKWPIYTRVEKSTYSNQVKKHAILYVWS